MIICDAAREQIQGDALMLCNESGCQIYQLEKDTPAANRAERYIKMVKDGTKKDLEQSNCPIVLWDYCVERQAKIISSVARTRIHTCKAKCLKLLCPVDLMTFRTYVNSNGTTGLNTDVKHDNSRIRQNALERS